VKNNMTLTKRYLPQNPDIEVFVPNYKEPILPVNHGGFGWYGLMSYNEEGKLMCHECGRFCNNLSTHIKMHNINKYEYKHKFGLLRGTKLVSTRQFEKSSNAAYRRMSNFEIHRNMLTNLKRARAKARQSHGNMALEIYNRYNTCPSQCLRLLAAAAQIYGDEISFNQVNSLYPNLGCNLIRRFGSFNKAKQILKLATCKSGHPKIKYESRIILEDAYCFHAKYERWPTKYDYKNGYMVCSMMPVRQRFGKLSMMILEAQKLKQEQEARRIRGEQIVQYANNIEMEFAGTARR